MGVSTDGCLVFGIDFDNELPSLVVNGYDFTEEQEEILLEDFCIEHLEEVTGEKQPEVEVFLHCSYEYKMHILSVGQQFSASRGYPEKIEALPEITEAQINELKEFCKRYKIEWTEPSWLLCSFWG